MTKCHLLAALCTPVVIGWTPGVSRPLHSAVLRAPDFSGLPVLSYLDQFSGVNVTLVGVSHGALSSSQLVSAVANHPTMSPSAIIVELCEERWSSISLEARIRPRGDAAMGEWYDSKVVLLDAQDEMLREQPAKYFFNRAATIFKFVKAQGPLGGVFVFLGLTVNALQRATRRNVGDKDTTRNEDEFVTAMQVAEKLDVPLLLGDAPQADTLKSLRRVLSLDIFKPQLILEGMRALRFSVLGVGAPVVGQGGDDLEEVVGRSEFISIPATYAKNREMLVGLAPILLIYMATVTLGLVAGAVEGADVVGSSQVESAGALSSLLSFLPDGLEQFVDATVGATIDVLSILFLIRFSTIIGTERDKIIADKVKAFCQQYPPGSNVVCVVGMLHMNGIALRGVRPGLI